MAVVGLAITARGPYADGMAFGDVGAYERIDGVLRFAVDPAHPANAGIVDLGLATRDAAGSVTFAADFCLLQPVDATRANRRLLFDVVNRGRKVAPRHLNRAATEIIPTATIDPGDGFLMRRGWTLAWCGWQWDVHRSAALMGLEAPTAPGAAGGWVRVWFQPNACERHKLLADRVHQPYNAADPDQPDATLRVRDWPDGPPTTIPRAQWRFARDADGTPVRDDGFVWTADGFTPGKVYEVIYRTRRAPVVGAGLLAVRDCVSFLRYGSASDHRGVGSSERGIQSGAPTAGRIETTYGFGVSQSGRFLRHFLYTGLNVDEAGRHVFDGLLIHVAGARRGEFNHRYGQPSDQHQPSFGHLPPFLDGGQQTADSGQRAEDSGQRSAARTEADPEGGLLDRQRAVGGVPKIVATNTAAEYWRGDTSLMHTDLAGTRDVEPAAETRIYHFASTQHGPGAVPLVDFNANDEARGRHGFNAVDYAPLLRAALVNLDRWVIEGMEPPPSVFPRLADGTAVPMVEALRAYAEIPGATLPDPAHLPTLRRVDLGPDAARGIARYPTVPGAPYRVYVAAPDTDGNERGGIRMPDVSVPVATYTGWNPRHPETGGAEQIMPMQGSTFPFARTAAERQASRDPRPAIAERYASREEYLAQVRAAALALVADRYLLPEDVTLAERIAAARYDYFAGR